MVKEWTYRNGADLATGKDSFYYQCQGTDIVEVTGERSYSRDGSDIVEEGGLDPDAQAIVTAVEAADGQALETVVKDALNNFVTGAKTAGIWSSLSSGVWRFLAGPRTLAGALKCGSGSDPTNIGFVSGDYSRTLGLFSNKSSYLQTDFVPLDNNTCIAGWISEIGTTADDRGALIGNWNGIRGYLIFCDNESIASPIIRANYYAQNSAFHEIPTSIKLGLHGVNRRTSASFEWSKPEATMTYGTVTQSSLATTSEPVSFFGSASVTGLGPRSPFMCACPSLTAGGLADLNSLVETYLNAISGVT